jgi:sigma-B regulation protein RsbU (phosphoserine phosphatase)
MVQSEGLPVGLFHDQKFSTTTLTVAPGDALVVYTDGVSEAENPEGTQFADSSLSTLLNACHALNSREMVERCIQAVLAFRAGSPKLDDQTILALQFSPDGHFARQ